MPETEPIRAFLSDRHLRLAAEIDAFAAASIAPLEPAADDDAARRRAREILTLLGAGGWTAYAVPAKWGGALEGVDLRACCLIREALAFVSPLADAVFALQALGSMPLALSGDDEVRRRWLPEVAAGRAMTAFALTEPAAGSDPGAMATRARRHGDAYVLSGGKTFISNAGIADLYTVFAATDPKAGTRGLTAFAVPGDSPGFVFRRPQVMSEPHPLGDIELDDCRVPTSARLGDEGEGFKVAMRTLDRLRPTVAAAACGMAARALDEALRHATGREQFGRPLADFQLTRQKLARMSTDLTAARLLTYRAASEGDEARGGGRGATTLAAAMAKAFATEAAQRVVDDAVQILGGRGVLADHPVDRLYRSVRALRIYEGTTEIQQLVIARELLRSRA